MELLDDSIINAMSANPEKAMHYMAPHALDVPNAIPVLDGFSIFFGSHPKSGRLLLPASRKSYLTEFLCDVYSVASRLVLDTAGNFDPHNSINIAITPLRLRVLGHLMFITEMVEGHKDGYVGERRIKMFSLSHANDEDREPETLSLYETHPRPFLRWLNIQFHLHLLTRRYWDFRETVIFRQAALEVATQFKPVNFIALDEAIEICKVCDDEESLTK